jgi:hypothetical protein
MILHAKAAEYGEMRLLTRIKEAVIKFDVGKPEPGRSWKLPQTPQMARACEGSFALLRMTDEEVRCT